MIVPTESAKRRYRDYITIVVLGLILKYIRDWTWCASVGFIFLIFMAVEILSELFGHVLARVLYERIYPKNIRELKHTEQQYQYILELDNKKEIYTYVYEKPLKDVEVRCWKFYGKYLIEVVRR